MEKFTDCADAEMRAFIEDLTAVCLRHGMHIYLGCQDEGCWCSASINGVGPNGGRYVYGKEEFSGTEGLYWVEPQ